MRSHDSAVYAVGRAVAIFRPNHWEHARGSATAGQTNAPLVDAGASRQRHATSVQNAAAGGAATKNVPNSYLASVVFNCLSNLFFEFPRHDVLCEEFSRNFVQQRACNKRSRAYRAF